jgi:hypothetical protein
MRETAMSTTVAQMTKDELQEMIGAVVEQKLVELLGDPDDGLSLKKSVRDQLERQMAAVARGERGKPLEEVIRRLGLE